MHVFPKRLRHGFAASGVKCAFSRSLCRLVVPFKAHADFVDVCEGCCLCGNAAGGVDYLDAIFCRVEKMKRMRLRRNEKMECSQANHLKAKTAVSAVCAAMLVLAGVLMLGGCSGSSAQITGTYDLYEIQGSNGTSHEEIEQLEKSGFTLFINLDEDKTFHLVMVGLDNDGTWECADGRNITFSPTQASLGMTDATIEDGKITMTLLGEPTVFAKGNDKKVEDYL